MIRSHVYKPVRYYLLTFLITYTLWFIGAHVSDMPDMSDLYMLFMLPGLLAPFLVSLAIVLRPGNSDLKHDFFNRLFNLRLMQPRMLPAFLLIMPLSVLASVAISVAFGGSTEQLQLAEGFSFSSGFVPVLVLLLLAATFEELGWRGYAFDSLRSKFSYFKATMIFSVLWSLWHLPLVFVVGSYQFEIVQQSIWYGVNFFISIVPMGVIISWMCIRNRKSIPVAILFHFLVNMSQELLNITQATKCIETGVLFAVAAVILVSDRLFAEHFSADSAAPVQTAIGSSLADTAS